MKYRPLLFLFVFLTNMIPCVDAQSERKHLLKGEKAYDASKYAEAEGEFGTAAEKGSAPGFYNRGKTRMEQKKYAEAIADFEKAIDHPQATSEMKIKATYNRGNAWLQMNEPEKAIRSYKQTLRLQPGHAAAAHNLLLAKQKQEEKQQQQNKDDEKQESDENNENPSNQQEGNDDKTNSQEENKKEQKQTDDQIPVNTAQLLQAIENEEANVRQKMQKRPNQKKSSGKSW
jgi:Ca-activated chloride channel family protein